MLETQGSENITTPASSPFIRQRDDFSCGVACLATAGRLYRRERPDYHFFRKELKPVPKIGTPVCAMSAVSLRHLPVSKIGEGSYQNGVAVALIMHGEGAAAEGHYVVFLCSDGENIIYYDPYDHKIIEKKIAEIVWHGECDPLERWALNFEPLQNNSMALWRGLDIPSEK